MDSTAQKLGLLHPIKTGEWVGVLVWIGCLCEKAQIHFSEKADLDLFKICLNSQKSKAGDRKVRVKCKKQSFRDYRKISSLIHPMIYSNENTPTIQPKKYDWKFTN